MSLTVSYVVKNPLFAHPNDGTSLDSFSDVCHCERWSTASLSAGLSLRLSAAGVAAPHVALIVKKTVGGDDVCLFSFDDGVKEAELERADASGRLPGSQRRRQSPSARGAVTGSTASGRDAPPRLIYVAEECMLMPVFSRTLPSVGGGAADANPWRDRPLLVVGAGGIGCELLKVLVLAGHRRIHLLDLDTVDATNLNRQFLFTSADVGRPKSFVARDAVLRWRCAEASNKDGRRAGSESGDGAAGALQVTAYHDNIKSERFSVEFISGFAAVLNALDNVSARQHVNRLCAAAGVPLVESGTMGYNGQAQPILFGRSECYDCHPKPPDQRTYAVCTIHARPTTVVHCVHYAKELYTALFAAAGGGGAAVAVDPSNREEEEAVQRAAQGEMGAWRGLVERYCAQGTTVDGGDGQLRAVRGLALELLDGLFREGIEQLLRLKSGWATAPPVPLTHDAVAAALDESCAAPCGLKQLLALDRPLTVAESVQLFHHSLARCCGRPPADFSKEDDAAVGLVAATASLRANAFHIACESPERLRGVAGAIVPAIATTNAIVAAAVAQQLRALLRDPAGARVTYVRRAPLLKRRALRKRPREGEGSASSPMLLPSLCPASSVAGPQARVTDHFTVYACPLAPPVAGCPVCQRRPDPLVTVCGVDAAGATLGDLVRGVLAGPLAMEAPSISCGATVVYEEGDYEDLAGRPLRTFAASAGNTAGADSVGEDAASAAGPRVVFHVDALNRSREWTVVVAPPGAAPSADPSRWTIVGLAEALEADKAAEDANHEAKVVSAEVTSATDLNNRSQDNTVNLVSSEDDVEAL